MTPTRGRRRRAGGRQRLKEVVSGIGQGGCSRPRPFHRDRALDAGSQRFDSHPHGLRHLAWSRRAPQTRWRRRPSIPSARCGWPTRRTVDRPRRLRLGPHDRDRFQVRNERVRAPMISGILARFDIHTIGFDAHNTSRFRRRPGRVRADLRRRRLPRRGRDLGPVRRGRPVHAVGRAHGLGRLRPEPGLVARIRPDRSGALRRVRARRRPRLPPTGQRVSPKITLGLRPLEGLQLYGTYAEGYRAPSVTETLIAGRPPLPRRLHVPAEPDPAPGSRQDARGRREPLVRRRPPGTATSCGARSPSSATTSRTTSRASTPTPERRAARRFPGPAPMRRSATTISHAPA